MIGTMEQLRLCYRGTVPSDVDGMPLITYDHTTGLGSEDPMEITENTG